MMLDKDKMKIMTVGSFPCCSCTIPDYYRRRETFISFILGLQLHYSDSIQYITLATISENYRAMEMVRKSLQSQSVEEHVVYLHEFET